MIKLNSKEVEELYNECNDSNMTRVFKAEEDQLEDLDILNGKIQEYPVLIKNWKEKLLQCKELLNISKQKVILFWISCIGAIAIRSFLSQIIIYLSLDALYVLLKSIIKFLINIGILLFLFLGVKETFFCYSQ